MARTTILVQDDLLLEVRRVAQSGGVTVTEVVNRALAAYVRTQPPSGLPSFTGVGRRESGNLSATAKRLARKAVDPYEGSSREGRR